jgi:hypothetical protein
MPLGIRLLINSVIRLFCCTLITILIKQFATILKSNGETQSPYLTLPSIYTRDSKTELRSKPIPTGFYRKP